MMGNIIRFPQRKIQITLLRLLREGEWLTSSVWAALRTTVTRNILHPSVLHEPGNNHPGGVGGGGGGEGGGGGGRDWLM